MPPRLNKRQLREQEELAELEAAKLAAAPDPSDSDTEENQEEEQDSTDDAVDNIGGPAVKSKSKKKKQKKQQAVTSAFAALDIGGDDDEEAEEEDEQVDEVVTRVKSKNKQKKKKAKGPLAAIASADGTTPVSGSTPATPSSASKKGAKSTEDDMDEIDRALAELAARNKNDPSSSDTPDASSSSATTTSTYARLDPVSQTLRSLLSIEPKLLDADAELRRMFGSKVISSTPNQPRSQHHARFANNPHHATSLKRTASYLCPNPESGWWSPSGVLGIEKYEGVEAREDGGKGEWWSFQHGQQYREAQIGFLEVLQQADGNRLYDVLQAQPYHVDTLMQLAEMNNQQGDLGAASSYLNKALYALSAPLPPSFPSGSFRLPYSQIENRAFFLGIARKVAILTKRGTWRTACEWAKIALGTGGEADPVGMLCFLDFLAPKAKQNTWFLSLLETLPKAYPGMRLEGYPGLAFAKALCLRNIEQEANEDDTKSTAALKSAILRFPMVVQLLFTALGGNVPPKLLTHRRAQLDGSFSTKTSYLLSLLSEFYSSRSSPLWKEPPVLAWLQKTVAAVAPSLDDSSLEDVKVGEKLCNEGPWPSGYAPQGVIRAAFIAEIPSLRPYLPPSALNGTSYSYDPLPPSSPHATHYNDAYFAPLYGGGSSSRRRRVQQQQGGRMIDPANLEAELARMDPVQRQAILDQLREMMEAGGLPGGFPGMEGDEDDTDEEDDEDQDAAGGGGGFFGRLANLVRGGGGGAPPAQ